MSDGPDSFEFLKALWNPLGLPLAGMVAPALGVPDIEKRIADLKLVENWLTLNLSMLRMSIQALEMQKATLAAMQAGAQDAAGAPASNPALDAWLKMMRAGSMASVTAPADPSPK